MTIPRTAMDTRAPVARPAASPRGRLETPPPIPRTIARTAYRVAVVAVVSLLTALGFAAGIAHGDYPLDLATVVEVLRGGGTRLERVVVLEWRLPRGVLGLLIGLALGMAGAITQSLSRNALASPDIIGLTMGASTGAVVWIVHGGPARLLPAAAVCGALATGLAISLLAWRRGMDPFRLVLVGVGVSAMLSAVVTYLLVNTNIDDAARATVWLIGSLDGRGWTEVAPAIVGVTLGVVLALVGAVDLRALHLGPDVAHGLGVRVARVRTLLLAAAVVLTGVAVATAGPVGFVALVSPQAARLVLRTPAPPLWGSALAGAFLVTAADLCARAVLPWELPVGIVTAAIGGPVLLALVVRAGRKVTV